MEHVTYWDSYGLFTLQYGICKGKMAWLKLNSFASTENTKIDMQYIHTYTIV